MSDPGLADGLDAIRRQQIVAEFDARSEAVGFGKALDELAAALQRSESELTSLHARLAEQTQETARMKRVAECCGREADRWATKYRELHARLGQQEQEIQQLREHRNRNVATKRLAYSATARFLRAFTLDAGARREAKNEKETGHGNTDDCSATRQDDAGDADAQFADRRAGVRAAAVHAPTGEAGVGCDQGSRETQASDTSVIGWQPIASAPKDGTRVLLRLSAKLVVAGRWVPETSVGPVGHWYTTDDFWRPEPTHWMPMPSPDLHALPPLPAVQGGIDEPPA